jgi:tetratricopeptide (TPR) repeat protein
MANRRDIWCRTRAYSHLLRQRLPAVIQRWKKFWRDHPWGVTVGGGVVAGLLLLFIAERWEDTKEQRKAEKESAARSMYADSLYSAGSIQDALGIYESLLMMAPASEKSTRAKLQMKIGEARFILGYYEDVERERNLTRSLVSYGIADALFQESRERELAAHARVGRGRAKHWLAVLKGDNQLLQESRQEIERALPLLNIRKSRAYVAVALSELGVIQYETSIRNPQNAKVLIDSGIALLRRAELLCSRNRCRHDIYSDTQINLGVLYVTLSDIQGPEENLRRAINAFGNAARVLNIESSPLRYARFRINVAAAYYKLSHIHARPASLDSARAVARQVLSLITAEDQPTLYATASAVLLAAQLDIAVAQNDSALSRDNITEGRKSLANISLARNPLVYALVAANLGGAYAAHMDVTGRLDVADSSQYWLAKAADVLNPERQPFWSAVLDGMYVQEARVLSENGVTPDIAAIDTRVQRASPILRSSLREAYGKMLTDHGIIARVACSTERVCPDSFSTALARLQEAEVVFAGIQYHHNRLIVQLETNRIRYELARARGDARALAHVRARLADISGQFRRHGDRRSQSRADSLVALVNASART